MEYTSKHTDNLFNFDSSFKWQISFFTYTNAFNSGLNYDPNYYLSIRILQERNS